MGVLGGRLPLFLLVPRPLLAFGSAGAVLSGGEESSWYRGFASLEKFGIYGL